MGGKIMEHSRTEQDRTEYGCTAAILTAVEIETRGIKHAFDGWKHVSIKGDDQNYYKTSFIRDGREHEIITAQQNVMGMNAATMLASKVIYSFRPKYVLMCGIAAGVADEAIELYGDVIVPDLIWDYSTGKYVGPDESEIRFGDVGFLPRPIAVKPDPEALEVVKSTIGDPGNEFHVHIGPMACGSSVVANSEMVDRQIKAMYPNSVGLDMESYSICYAAEACSTPRPRALVIKSICDYANSEKSDKFQRFAAYTSSGYAKYLLEEKLEL